MGPGKMMSSYNSDFMRNTLMTHEFGAVNFNAKLQGKTKLR